MQCAVKQNGGSWKAASDNSIQKNIDKLQLLSLPFMLLLFCKPLNVTF